MIKIEPRPPDQARLGPGAVGHQEPQSKNVANGATTSRKRRRRQATARQMKAGRDLYAQIIEYSAREQREAFQRRALAAIDELLGKGPAP